MCQYLYSIWQIIMFSMLFCCCCFLCTCSCKTDNKLFFWRENEYPLFHHLPWLNDLTFVSTSLNFLYIQMLCSKCNWHKLVYMAKIPPPSFHSYFPSEKTWIFLWTNVLKIDNAELAVFKPFNYGNVLKNAWSRQINGRRKEIFLLSNLYIHCCYLLQNTFWKFGWYLSSGSRVDSYKSSM